MTIAKTTVAIVSDTHAVLDERIANIIQQCDYAIHAGDVCGEAVLENMKPKSGEVYAVAGNNDVYIHGDSLPQQTQLDLPTGSIAIEHGHLHGMQKPCHDSLRKAHPDARVIVYGHTHKMLQDKTQKTWVVNPGAAGTTRTRGGPSCLVLTCEGESWEFTEYRFSEDDSDSIKTAA